MNEEFSSVHKPRRAYLDMPAVNEVIDFVLYLISVNIIVYITEAIASILSSRGFYPNTISSTNGFVNHLTPEMKKWRRGIDLRNLVIRENFKPIYEYENSGKVPMDIIAIQPIPYAKDGHLLQVQNGSISALEFATTKYQFVTVISDPSFIPELISEMNENLFNTRFLFREGIARRVRVDLIHKYALGGTEHVQTELFSLDSSEQSLPATSCVVPISTGLSDSVRKRISQKSYESTG